ncbi:unnamed protein product (macronuclear) [Paramecium tetraurelia]|uniref:Uncharacterized protein n=1 Tax=Paramecium tetraurelia TaxID=5888 RepID=A0BBY3_PARTE|nr:uncharacterized protein GSPATT00000485001 [Paramecium tetraurelia]CAK56050.1 unnamed protein product [Paramecium tetraurelia]|eukprot:XP_001423448.1 hypothetical protein (macronuclear) [Paramecium tetraurelia strain d4-2]
MYQSQQVVNKYQTQAGTTWLSLYVGCKRMFDKLSSESSLSHFVKSHRPNRARSHLWDPQVMRVSHVLKNLAMAQAGNRASNRDRYERRKDTGLLN